MASPTNIDRLIYDVGAHRGEDTEFYLNKGFSVVAIEAVPEFCDELKKKFGNYLKEGKLTVLNFAISSTTGEVDFYVDEKNTVWGTTNLDWVERNKSTAGQRTIKKIRVASMSLNNVMKVYGVPRYCKIDIEGNDLDAVKSLKENTLTPKFVSIESDKSSWEKLLEEFQVLSELGYKKYKIVDQTTLESQRCPNPSQEGKYLDHRFQFGSSGLFGDELPGRWLDMSEAIEAYKNIFRGYALNGDNGLFRGAGRRSVFDLLGRIDVGISRLRGLRNLVNPARILPPPGWYDTHAAL
jgi:FkbM family methyltransferase